MAISNSRSKRPGRRRADSITFGRLVAPMTITFELVLRESIKVNNCETTRFSVSPCASSRLGAIESSSSMKMIEGAFSAASSNACRRLASDSPPLRAIISGPLMMTTCAPVSSTKAFASRVFPHPGGPCNKTPLGVGTPAVVQSSGNRRGISINSRISVVALSSPPTESYPAPTNGRGVLPPTTATVSPVNSPATAPSSSSAPSSSDFSGLAPSTITLVTTNSSFRPSSSFKSKTCPNFNKPPDSSRYGPTNLALISSSEIESPPSIASRDDRESSMGERVTDSTIGAESALTKANSPLRASSEGVSSVRGTILTLSPFRSLRFLARFSETTQVEDDTLFFFLSTKTRPYVAVRLLPMTATTSPFETPSSLAFLNDKETAESVIAVG
mmetsp:Transcript_724/g.1534  ORF Transcript_724/g.1534 Transcript_724/m.1534 type:complete len:387 (+) Transcript_724:1414-2574(+)